MGKLDFLSEVIAKLWERYGVIATDADESDITDLWRIDNYACTDAIADSIAHDNHGIQST